MNSAAEQLLQAFVFGGARNGVLRYSPCTMHVMVDQCDLLQIRLCLHTPKLS